MGQRGGSVNHLTASPSRRFEPTPVQYGTELKALRCQTEHERLVCPCCGRFTFRFLTACRSRDALTPQLPANSEWDQSQLVVVLRGRVRRLGEEAKRLATRSHKVSPSRQVRKWVKDSAGEARKPVTQSKKPSLQKVIGVTGRKSKSVRTRKIHSS